MTDDYNVDSGSQCSYCRINSMEPIDKLSKNHLIAIYVYTDYLYAQFNMADRNDRKKIYRQDIRMVFNSLFVNRSYTDIEARKSRNAI